MNIESYQQCIESLEKEIKSRQQERLSMENQIVKLDTSLGKQYENNKYLRDEVNKVNQQKEKLFKEILIKEQISNQKNQLLNKSNKQDQQTKQRLIKSQAEKDTLRKQIQNNLSVIFQQKNKIQSIQSEIRKQGSLIDSYKQIITEKTDKIAKSEYFIEQLEDKNKNQEQQISKIRAEFDSERQSLFLVRQEKDNANSTIQQQVRKISMLEMQISDFKSNSQNSNRFFEDERTKLRSIIKDLQQKSQQLKNSFQQMEISRNSFQKQANNKDQIIGTLISQINFLKEEKEEIIELKKKQSIRLEQLQKQMLEIGMDFSQKKTDLDNLQNQVKDLTKEINNKNINIKDLQQRISQSQTQKQSIKQQKSKQIEKVLLQKSQLSERLRQLSFQTTNSNSSKAELKQVINNHEQTIQSLNGLLEQLRKINQDVSKLLSTKTKQVQALEQSNTMLRREKLQFLKKQQQYRKKIIEFRNKNTTSSKSFRQSNLSNSTRNFIALGQQQMKGSNSSRNLFFSSRSMQKFHPEVQQQESEEMIDFDFNPIPKLDAANSIHSAQINGMNKVRFTEEIISSSVDQKDDMVSHKRLSIEGQLLNQNSQTQEQKNLHGSMNNINKLLDKLNTQ